MSLCHVCCIDAMKIHDAHRIPGKKTNVKCESAEFIRKQRQANSFIINARMFPHGLLWLDFMVSWPCMLEHLLINYEYGLMILKSTVFLRPSCCSKFPCILMANLESLALCSGALF